MNRISRHLCFMQCAEAMARRSTCFRRNVGAVITVDNRIISCGYNGSSPGEPHCIGKGCAGASGCTRAVHAEINVLEYVPSNDMLKPKVMYVTESPCPDCARAIVKDGTVKAVYYLNQYRLIEGCEILIEARLPLYRMTPAGHVVDYLTNELIDEG